MSGTINYVHKIDELTTKFTIEIGSSDNNYHIRIKKEEIFCNEKIRETDSEFYCSDNDSTKIYPFLNFISTIMETYGVKILRREIYLTIKQNKKTPINVEEKFSHKLNHFYNNILDEMKNNFDGDKEKFDQFFHFVARKFIKNNFLELIEKLT